MRTGTTWAAAAALAAGLLAGCGGGDDEPAAAGQSAAASAPVESKSGDTSEAGLKKAAQAYADGFLSGNILKIAAYLPPECTDEDRGSLMMGLGMFKQMAGDAKFKMNVEEVSVDGSAGEVLRYSFSGEVPEELERLMTTGDGSPSEPELWKVVKGKWYRADCEG